MNIVASSPASFRIGLVGAKSRLEDCVGRAVIDFRAPDFSITTESLWALDILAEAGFRYDFSIYPIALHDVYGIDGAERTIHRLPNELIEFPLATVTYLGRSVPFGGGGYFRLYPIWLTRRLIRSWNRERQPVMFYVHPYEIGPFMPDVKCLSLLRRFRHYHNCDRGSARQEICLLTSASAPPARCSLNTAFWSMAARE